MNDDSSIFNFVTSTSKCLLLKPCLIPISRNFPKPILADFYSILYFCTKTRCLLKKVLFHSKLRNVMCDNDEALCSWKRAARWENYLRSAVARIRKHCARSSWMPKMALLLSAAWLYSSLTAALDFLFKGLWVAFQRELHCLNVFFITKRVVRKQKWYKLRTCSTLGR